ncbi:hypothetical protein [Frondihabitans cladoniiphilus]|uniref:Uncharacterized protein n=1 Tax=Frondihabitans cladoniiphilus TaxID=715785 RepID=A0ABP8W3J8_9MICO
MPAPAAAVKARLLLVVVALLAILGIVSAAVVAHERATAVDLSHGAATEAPWPAPEGLGTKDARAALARLDNVYGQKLAEHIHAHLSIVVDGHPVTVPGQIGLDEAQHFATSLHTHNTSGIIHVESPVVHDFTLGQFFTEWDVRLDARHIGASGGDLTQTLTVFVDGERRLGDPSSIVLHDLDSIELVVAPAGQVVRAEPAFDWPSNYH